MTTLNRKYRLLLTLALSLLCGACSKIIEVEYESLDPLYVVEANLCDGDEGSYVVISQTVDMEEPLIFDPLTSATVMVTGSDGEQIAFAADDEGFFLPTQSVTLSEGSNYTLQVEVGGETFSATSHLHAAPVITDVNFSMFEYTADHNLIFCTFYIDDLVGETNYYRYRFRYFANDNEESGEPSWSLAKESGDGDPIGLMTHLYTRDRDFEDGDTVTIEVQAIDKSAYDYLYTLSQSGSSATNPTSSMVGGCLGYFSAYSLSTYIAEFYYSEL